MIKNKQKLFRCICIYVLLVSTNTLYAKTERYSFDVFLWGIKVGELVYSIKQTSDDYDISGVLSLKVWPELLLNINLKLRHKERFPIQNITPPITAKNQIQVVEKSRNL